jgi:abortive infection bacteriophage resistance protein
VALLPYEKPYKNPKLLIDKLITEELTIDNRSHAEQVLSRINYYRFKAYSRPFRASGSGKFNPETTFDDIEQLYHFDDSLRDLCFSHISKLEIQLRSRLDQVIASSENDPFWYLNNSVYAEFGDMDSFAEHIQDKFKDSDEEFVTHFKINYQNPSNGDYPELPPSWVAVELFTLGTLNTLFLKLNIDHFNVGSSDEKNHLNVMSKEFGAISFINLRSWLEVIKQIRNKCAHHARLFNVKIKPWPRSSRLFDDNYKAKHDRRIYVSLWMLHRMLKSIGTPKDTKAKIQQLFERYPSAEKLKNAMGFPENWEDDPHWDLS